jgi:hypothetical protein
MPIIHKSCTILSSILLASQVSMASGQSAANSDAINKAQRQISAYLVQLADLHCAENVTQEKLTGNGHVEASARARYDYLIMMSGNGDDFQLNESRIESSDSHHELTSKPMLVTNGIATVLLVFHPYYRDGFNFETGAEESVDGKPVIPIHFTHIPGRRTPAALALRGREYPLDLEGTAWLDKQTGDVVKVDAALLHDMSDVGLRSLHIHVEYKLANLNKATAPIALPARAVVDLTTPRQHWRNTHLFEDYKSFSTAAEQDPNVKVHSNNDTPDSDKSPAVVPHGSKEKQ